MIAAEHIEDWRGSELRDPSGESIGKLHEVYLDVDTGTPILFATKSGLLGRHVKMIPADGAVVGPNYVRVKHDQASIESSPNADKDEPPDAVELDEIGKAYDLRFSEKVRLESATVAEARRAEAAEAHRRAEELEAQAREKAAALQSAKSRSEGASTEAQQAEAEAEEAREAARRARLEADRHTDS
jgi:hypothetical protein